MSNVLWLLSFFYLAALTGWVTAALREDLPHPLQAASEGGVDGEGEPEEHVGTARRALSFTVMMVVATAVFAGIILAVERFT